MSSPILLIPGLNCSARLFAGQVPSLWRAGPVTIADHRHGSTMAELARSILAAAPPRFALVGFSMGGYIAFEILRQAAARVTQLALVDTSARPDAPEQTAKRRERIALTQAGRYDEAVESQFPALVHTSHREDRALKSVFRQMAEECGPEAFVRHLNAILARPDSRPDLGAIKCKTLVIVGDSDEVTPPEHAREMASGIAGASLTVVPTAGHLSPLEQPEAVANALAGWLATSA